MKKRQLFSQSMYRFMRLGLLPLLMINCMTAMIYASPSSGQEVLDKKINLVADQKEVKAILNELSKLAEIKFVYSAQRVPCHQKVSLEAKDRKLSEVLDQLLTPLDIFYHLSGNQIVLMKKGDEHDLVTIQNDETKKMTDLASTPPNPITGKVTNESGEPLAGVSVLVKGTSRGTTTNAMGVFSLSADPGETLEFSFIGFQMGSARVGQDGANISVRLQAKSSTIEEIVVIGYGTQKRTSVTGAVSTVGGNTIKELPVVSVQQALQGRVAGVSVTNNGSPGTEPLVAIRGISSISFGSGPLYVIDGFPTGDLSTIDTRDIESVDVLKDASAAAIYGSRATNGVIMITTRKGRRDGKINVSLDSYYGTQVVTKRLSLLNTSQFMKYSQAYNGAVVPRLVADFNTPIYAGTTQTYGQTNTDWQDAYFKHGSMTQHDVGLSGGNAVSRFYASAGYLDQLGISPHVGYRRYNFRLNSDHIIGKAFTFGENLYLSYGDQAYDNNESGTRTNLVNVTKMMPHIPVHDPTTSDGFRGVNSVLDGGDPTNPVEDATIVNPGQRSTLKLFGTAYLEVAFTKWLKFRTTAGIDYASGLDYRFRPIYNDGGTVAGSSSATAGVFNNRSISAVQLYTQQLTFDRTFGSHHINALAVYEYQGQKVRAENESGTQQSNTIQDLQNAQNPSVQTTVKNYTILSYLGRLSYDFEGKYLVNAAIRRDGVSTWAPGQKYGTFPSGSIGWRIDQEKFMKDQTRISELKVRAGYGVTGINSFALGQTPWEATVAANSAYYPFGNNITAGAVSSIPGLGNLALNWEKTKQINIGLDLGLLNNKITVSTEYYQRKTDNLILQVPIPLSMGYLNGTVPQNVAAMTNKGFELQLGYNQRHGDFKWNASANLSIITNKVVSLAPGVTNIEAGADGDLSEGYNITNTAPGHPIQSFYGWQTEGIFQDSADIKKHAVQTSGTGPGDLKFKDLNSDKVVDNKDRTYLGSFIPKFTYAFNLGANFKNFDASVFFQGVQGNKIFNALRVQTEGMIRFFNAGTNVLNAWTTNNTNTAIPRAISSDPNQNARPSNRFIEDGSYLRLKNVMLGYNIPMRSLSTVGKGAIKSFRIYVSAQNILTFTKYTGYDPEIGNHNPGGSTLTNGIDYSVYPQPKAYQVGIQANF